MDIKQDFSEDKNSYILTKFNSQYSSFLKCLVKVKMFMFAPGVQLSKIVDAVNSVGASPSDLVAILEALKQAGALHAELIVI